MKFDIHAGGTGGRFVRTLPVRDLRGEGLLSPSGGEDLGAAQGWEPPLDGVRTNLRSGPS